MIARFPNSSKTCSKCSRDTCCETIYQLILEARQNYQRSHQRNRYLTQAIRELNPKLWRTNTPYYGDALQQTWLYFAQKGYQTYDRDRGCIVTWLNSYLWYRHRDLAQQAIKRQSQEIPIDLGKTQPEGIYRRVISEIPSPAYGSLDLLKQVSIWIANDPNKTLGSTHIRNRPDITAQTLIQLRLPPETAWKDISVHFDVSISTLSTFYHRQCLPLLRNFGQSEGLF
jgi:hypothetical protein